jgi:hypothetical protein
VSGGRNSGDWPGFLDLRHGGPAEPAQPGEPPAGPQRLDPQDQPAFHRRLVDFLRRNRPAGESVAAGNVQVLDLDDVRRHFGPRWPSAKQKLHLLTDLTIRHHVGPQDLFFLADDEEFVIMFAKAGKAEAAVKARAIAAEVNAKLSQIGIEGAHVTVRGFAVEVLASKLASPDVTAHRLRAAVAEAAAADARAAPRALKESVEPPHVEYWPVANVRKRLVSLYDARIVGGSERAQDSLRTVMTDVDCFFVASAAETLARSALPHHKACLLIAAHFETLAVKTYRDAYLQACRALPQIARRRLILELLQVPVDVPQSRLLQMLGMVAPFFLGFALRVPLGFHAPERYRGLKVLAFTVDGRHLAYPTTREFDQLQALADSAKRHRIRTVFLNAVSLEAAAAARYAHCEYIDGEVVGPRTADPGRSYALKRPGHG